jgi:fatty acid desaturase
LPNDFHRELQEEAINYFKDTKQCHRGGLEMGLRVSFWCFIGIFLIYCVIFGDNSSWLPLLLSPVLGWWMASVGLAIQHDANHGALFQSSTLNDIMGLFDDFIGGSSLIWRHHHVVGHHLFTNDEKEDPDASAGLPMVRFHPSSPYNWYNSYQHFYFPILSALFGFTYHISDTKYYLNGNFKGISIHPLSLRDRMEFWCGKFINLFLFLILPFCLHGFSFLPRYFFLQSVGSLYLALTFAVSHNTTEIYEQEPTPSKDWAELQIRQSSNWGTDNWFANFLTGGLNQQIEHHLFPSVSHRHYPALSKIVRKKCLERNIPYVTYNSFYENLCSLFAHLKNLGKPPSKKDL